MAIPVIDIFAGPGGLGEGFCSLLNEKSQRVFKIVLSIERDEHAHKTLTLRSFFRQFEPGAVHQDYYEFVKGKMSLVELFERHPLKAKVAKEEAWLAELGTGRASVPDKAVDHKIRIALKGIDNWLLIGGPPCQAYSVVGRSRRQEKILDENRDERVGLYKQYLRILAVHSPTVFVMENVKGLLSAETQENPIFSKILKDLSDPATAYISDVQKNGYKNICPGYKIYSLSVPANDFDDRGTPLYQQKDFVIQAENHGIPQTRHRVILLGIRRDIDHIPETLKKMDEVAVTKVLADLPRLRSGLSKDEDHYEKWRGTIKSILRRGILKEIDEDIKAKITEQLDKVRNPQCGIGDEFVPYQNREIEYRQDWFSDKNLKGACNHKSRSHMESDLRRYFFASCYARIKGTSPKLEHFPAALLPNHMNVNEAIYNKKFADRFRVQLSNKPAKTITSHISKDGHYYIHYDPTQCRSLTVREAARIQTFPDNYFFCGPRTSQFSQVGNAVPPLLANKIAEIVHPVFKVLALLNKNDRHVDQTLISNVVYEF